jgi:hypothetical protein
LTKKLLDKPTSTVNDLAKKYGVPVLQVKKQLLKGIKVEKEHTDHPKIAREIALDHLGERLDYYTKLDKAHLEESDTGGIRGLGYTSGDPAGTNYVQQYIDTNAMSYTDNNGSKLEYIKKKHIDHHNKSLGYNFFDPTKIKSSSNFINEARERVKTKLNELGGSGEPNSYTGLTDAPPKLRANDQLEEGPKLDKAKKVAKTVAITGMTAANMYTMGDAISQHKPRHQTDMVRAASALPGAAGWGASAIHYGKKGYDLAKAALKKKQMEEDTFNEDLRKWFREKWVRYDTKGNIKGPCAREEGEGKPKCRPLASARAMSKDERAKSARRKRREDPVADRPGKGGKPIMVNTNEETLLEKNVPTNPALWARAKAQAKAKFDVYPSAYANGWASKWYKSKGGGWKSATNESVEDKTDASDETGMAKTQLKAISSKANNLDSKLKNPKNLPAWVQSKIAVAKDGITAVDDYMSHTGDKFEESAAWQRSAGKDPEGGLNRKGIASYRRENPGSKLSMAVTTPPSKLDPKGKAAKRRKSFCARMGGMKGPMKDEKGRPTRKALALRKWNCEEETNALPQTTQRGIYEKHLTPAETKKKEEIVMSMKKGLPGMKKRYGERAKEVLYATATKRAKQVAEGQIDEMAGAGAGAQLASMISFLTPPRLAAGLLADKISGQSAKDDEVKNLKGSINQQRKLDAIQNAADWPDNRKSTQMNEISAEKVGKVHLRYLEQNKPVPPFVSRAVIKKWLESKVGKVPEKTSKKQVKENSKDKDWDEATGPMGKGDVAENMNKPDTTYAPGATGITKTIYEETTMENQNLINEAIENILENDLGAMKDNFMAALQEKAQEKLEEKKKQIASDYFAQ